MPRSPFVPSLVALVALAACGGNHATAPATATLRVPAQLAVAERVDVARRVDLAGTVVAARSAVVSTRVSATVTAVHVALGDHVRRGQLLVTIDPTTAQGQLGQAQGGLTQAQAALTLAQRNFERFRALAASGSASELELDLARSQYEQAKGAVEQASGAVAAAGSVAAESRVVAPFAGHVAARMVDVGDFAAPGKPLVTIESEAGRRLVASVPEGLALRAALMPGATLGVSLDAEPERGELDGRVAEVSPGPDPTTHAYTVKVDLPDDVPAGAAGRLWIPTGTASHVLVPAGAVLESGGLDLVVVRGAGEVAESRVVTLGGRQPDGRIEILSGLDGGESVAVGLATAPPAGALLVGSGS